jgi:hypothetical protein
MYIIFICATRDKWSQHVSSNFSFFEILYVVFKNSVKSVGLFTIRTKGLKLPKLSMDLPWNDYFSS